MQNLINTYKQIIIAWQESDFLHLENIPVDESLLPLKLLLLNRSDEAKELLNSIDTQGEDPGTPYLLEAQLYILLSESITKESVELAQKITSTLEEVYFSNIILANHYISKRNFLDAINSYKKALSVASHSENLLAELVSLLIATARENEAKLYTDLLGQRANRFFGKLGLIGLSSKSRRVFLGIALLFICLFFRKVIYIFLPFILIFMVAFFIGIKNRNRLISTVSFDYLLIISITSLIGYISNYL